MVITSKTKEESSSACENSQSSVGSSKQSRSKTSKAKSTESRTPSRRGRKRKAIHSRRKLMFDDENATTGEFSEEDEGEGEEDDGEEGIPSHESETFEELDYSSSNDSSSVAHKIVNKSEKACSSNATTPTAPAHSNPRHSRLSTDSRPGTPFSLRKQIALAVQLSSDQAPSSSEKSSSSGGGNCSSTSTINIKTSSTADASSPGGGGQLTLTPTSSALPCAVGSSSCEGDSTADQSTGDETCPKKFLTQNKKGETELHFAAIRGDLHELRYYLSNEWTGANRKHPSASLNNSNTSVIPVDVNVQDFAGWTPLHETCNRGIVQAARVLLEYGADPNVAAFCGTTPVIDAVVNHQHSIIKLLIKRGADPFKKNRKGLHAFDLVTSAEEEDLLADYFRMTNTPLPKDFQFKFIDTPKDLQINQDNKEDKTPEAVEEPKQLEKEKTSEAVLLSKLEIVPEKEEPKGETEEIRIVVKSPTIPAATNLPKIVRIKDLSPERSKSDELKLTLKIPRSNSSDTLAQLSSAAQRLQQYSTKQANDKITTVLKVKKVRSIGEQVRSQSFTVEEQSVEAKPCLKSKFKLNSLSNTYQLADNQSSFQSKEFFLKDLASRVSSSAQGSLPTSMATTEVTSTSTSLTATESSNVPKCETAPTIANLSTAVSLVASTSSVPAVSSSNNAESSDNNKVVNIHSTDPNGSEPDHSALLSCTSSTLAPVPHSLRGRKRRKSADQADKSSNLPKKTKEAGAVTLPMGSGDGKTANVTAILKFKRSEGEFGEDETEEAGEGDQSIGAHLQQPLKVPPLRIVLPPSTTGAAININNPATTVPNIVVINPSSLIGSSNNPSSSSIVLTTSGERSLPILAESSTGNFSGLTTGKYPYVVHGNNSQMLDESDGAEARASSPSSSMASSGAASTTTTTTTRITRSSQRVANQKAHHHGGSDDDATPSHTTRKKKNRGGLGSAASGNNQQQQSYSRSNSPLTLGMQQSQQHHDHDDNSSSSTASGPMVASNGGPLPPLASCSASAANPGSEAQPAVPSTSTAPSNCTPAPDQAPAQQYDPDRNPYRMYQSIRTLVLKRRQAMRQVNFDPPRDFGEYLLASRSYLLFNSSKETKPKMCQPPSSLKPRTSLYQLFVEQEQERHRLRVQHKVQQDKVRLSFEQETLRLRTRLAHAEAQQLVPLSVCTYLKDDEIYNLVEFANDPLVDNVIISHIREDNSRFQNDGPSGMTNCFGGIKCPARTREFPIWTAEVNEKWRKIKLEMLARQKLEAEALACKQKLRWIWKQCQSDVLYHGPASGEQAHFDALSVEDMYVPTIKVPGDVDPLLNGV